MVFAQIGDILVVAGFIAAICFFIELKLGRMLQKDSVYSFFE